MKNFKILKQFQIYMKKQFSSQEISKKKSLIKIFSLIFKIKNNKKIINLNKNNLNK